MLLLAVPAVVSAAPGDVLFSDNFERNNLAPWTTTNAGISGILNGVQTSGSPTRAGYTSNSAVSVTSPTFNAAVPAARLTFWVRRGSDALPNSEDTDANENLVIEYQTAGGSWIPIVTYQGGGTNGEIINGSFSLPQTALHGSLALRARQTQGSGFDWDYWHFDDFVVTEIAPSGQLVVGGCDFFENGLSGNWNVNPTSGAAGVSGATSLSPSNSMFLNGGIVNVTSNVVDTSDPTFEDLTLWIRRGADAFSEDPDSGENLVVEFLNSSNTWVILETFNGAGQQGQQFTRSYNIPINGRHAGFQLRFRMTGGSGLPWDYWHIDDVCLTQNTDPVIQVSKVASTVSDPVNGTSGPYAIPGAIVEYTITVTNQGLGPVDADTIVISDPLPANTALFVSTVSGDPIAFVEGATSSGLFYNFATDVEFSSAPGGAAPFTYTPTPDADGFDPLVTGFRVNPSGAMNGSTGLGDPSFSIVFRLRIE